MILYYNYDYFIWNRHAAVSYGHIDLVDFLLSHGANINLRDADGDTPILVCEEPQVFEFLVNRGANPKDINSIGETILDKAAQDENEALINYLVSNGYITRDEAEFYIKKTEMDRLAEIEEIGGEDDTINDDNDGSVIS
jgi:ankyrin repeat protein